jgi:hypothetical protein
MFTILVLAPIGYFCHDFLQNSTQAWLAIIIGIPIWIVFNKINAIIIHYYETKPFPPEPLYPGPFGEMGVPRWITIIVSTSPLLVAIAVSSGVFWLILDYLDK